jgi:ppGpp synthetase/RelA/SpoT-type nucleotidyltranferase
MSYKTKPKYSKTAINKAGQGIRDKRYRININGNTELAPAIINNYRASHSYILNTFQANLRNRCKDKPVTFAQRLKRQSTIYNKLRREPKMQLARMHDIAGCRLIFQNIKELNDFQKSFRNSRFNHVRRYKDKSTDPYDYINNPKNSGYRGKHDVYQYAAYATAGEPWNGLNLEIQYRTQVQHAWATAVEIAGSITENKPKFNEGDERYLNFFRLSSEILARKYEDMTGCLPDLSDEQIFNDFNDLENEIHLLRSLANINQVNTEFNFGKNVILIFDENLGSLTTERFSNASSSLERYFELEKDLEEHIDIVLVRSDSSESIKYAFRNYFSDSTAFVELIEQALQKQ